MDKEQATQFILTRLQAGDGADEISADLGHLLKAPSQAVKRFVDQVIETAPPVPAEVPETSLQANTPPLSPQFNNDLPPGLQALLNEEASSAQVVEPVPPPKPQFTPGPAIQQNPKPKVQTARNSDLNHQEDSSNIDLDALSENILNQLKRQRRQNDIVEYVCHQTGWHWNQAQRFVARVKTQNHDQLQTRQNTFIIIVGIGIIAGGLIAAFYGASVLSDLAKLALLAETDASYLLEISPRALIASITFIVMGIGMILGGGYGIARVLREGSSSKY